MIDFRKARREDVPAVVGLLVDDHLGAGREDTDLDRYFAAFDTMLDEGNNHLIVGEDAGRIVATYQLTFISGLSLRAARRAQIESVRVASDLRGQGIGEAMLRNAEDRARAAGCTLMQLTMNSERTRTAKFYERMGYEPTHTGWKRALS